MADVWANYREVADLCGCSPDEARALVGLRGWPRRRCSDDITRTKLPDDLAFLLMTRSMTDSRLDTALNQSISALKQFKRSTAGSYDAKPVPSEEQRSA